MKIRLPALALLAMPTYSLAIPVSTDVPRNQQTIIKAASAVLAGEGYPVRYADPRAGQLQTSAKLTALTATDADCGKMLGFSYLKDKRTETSTTAIVNATDGKFTVDVAVTGLMRVGAGEPDKDLDCRSLGQIEGGLAKKIAAAALELEDEAPPQPAADSSSPPTLTQEEDAPGAQVEALIAAPKTVAEALEVIWARLNIEEIKYRPAVALSITYQNKTSKRIIGTVVTLTVTDPFGKVVLRETMQDATAINPGALHESDAGYYWPDNQFIQGEPFDRMAQSVANGSAKVKATVSKVIFEDGSSVETRPKPPKKPR